MIDKEIAATLDSIAMAVIRLRKLGMDALDHDQLQMTDLALWDLVDDLETAGRD